LLEWAGWRFDLIGSNMNSVIRELQECAQLDDFQWSQSGRSAVSYVFEPKRIDWHKEFDGKKLRLTLLEVQQRFYKSNTWAFPFTKINFKKRNRLS
jgi:hypothetical protein